MVKMRDRKSLERFLNECRISEYKVKDEVVVPGVSQRSIYTLVHGENDKLEVYETVGPVIIVSARGNNFPFAAALVFALEMTFQSKAQLVYLDKLGELQDLTAYYSPLVLPDDIKDGFLRQHRALGYAATVIDTAELEKAAAGYLK